MADEKKKKKEKKGSGMGTVFMIGLIIGIVAGMFLGWMTPTPSFVQGLVQETKSNAKGAANKVRGSAADALEGGADTVRPEDEK